VQPPFPALPSVSFGHVEYEPYGRDGSSGVFRDVAICTTPDKARVYRNTHSSTGWGPFWRDLKENADRAVRCACGSEQFYLRYGDYSLIATCSSCGSEDEVYSG
jgi:hypothetical protein